MSTQIANTILEQIGLGGRMNLGCRGAVAFSEGLGKRGGVQFTVGNGRYVARVTLLWNDTYQVQFLTKRSGRVAFDLTGVYCDQLADVLIRGLHECQYGKKAA